MGPESVGTKVFFSQVNCLAVHLSLLVVTIHLFSVRHARGRGLDLEYRDIVPVAIRDALAGKSPESGFEASHPRLCDCVATCAFEIHAAQAAFVGKI